MSGGFLSALFARHSRPTFPFDKNPTEAVRALWVAGNAIARKFPSTFWELILSVLPIKWGFAMRMAAAAVILATTIVGPVLHQHPHGSDSGSAACESVSCQPAACPWHDDTNAEDPTHPHSPVEPLHHHNCGICLILLQCAPAVQMVSAPVCADFVHLLSWVNESGISAVLNFANARGPPQNHSETACAFLAGTRIATIG